MADKSNQFMNEFMRQMTQNSNQNVDNYNRILHSLSSISDSLDNIDSKFQRILTTPGRIPSQSEARDEILSSNRPFGQHHAGNVGRNGPEIQVNVDKLTTLLESAVQDLHRLRSIDENIAALLGRQNATADTARGQRGNPQSGGFQRDPFGDIRGRREAAERSYRSFLDAFEESLIDSLGGREFKDKLNDALTNFAEHLGVDLEEVEGGLGDQFGRMFANNIRNSPMGQGLLDRFSNITDSIFSRSGNLGDLFANLRNNPSADISHFMEGLKGIDLGRFGNALVAGGDKITGFVGKFIGKGNAWMLLLNVAIKGISTVAKYITKNFQMIGDGFKELWEGVKRVGNRYYESLEKNQQYAQERLIADARTLIEEPFKILQEAASEVYDTWNANIRLIAGTQGYDKAGLQDLMSAYSQRLQSEGLDRVVASTDIYSNLGKVIQSGLTGNAAVEFAYQATKYNAAIPNHDFFNYVDTYSSIAANAVAAGKSETEAINIANQSLAEFSNGLLYASRNLTGGFSTGLKDAESLYSSAAKIAQAAKSDNISGIANSLLAVQGYTGAVAPDLATSLSDKIYQLATGGNNDDLVALRSLAGVNASNTEFLKYFSRDPQSVLSTMFANLGKMYTDTTGAYMEKAEGYATLFGLSSEAFQRIDFMSLSNAIMNMSSDTTSLDQNMELLKEGQSTTNADQLKIAQINQYMIEEGLAYVIDNEAAQLIQQHMWDEQMQREMMEATYGVDLVGTAAASLRKILTGIENILNLLNPVAWLSKLGNISKSLDEAADITADIKGVLEAGVVGEGNAKDLYNLTTRNEDLKLTRNLVDMMGGKGRYGNSFYNKEITNVVGGLAHPLNGLYDLGKKAVNQMKMSGSSGGGSKGSLPSSSYSWGSVSKSSAKLSSALVSQPVGNVVEEEVVSNVTGAVSTSVALIQDKIDQMLSDEYLYEQYAKQSKSYQEWLNSGRSLGISDMDNALKEAGYDPDEVEMYYQQKQTQAGMARNYESKEQESAFYEAGTAFWNTRFWEEYNVPLTELMNNVIGQLDTMIALQTEWKELQLIKLQEITDNQINWKNYFDTVFKEYRVQFDTDWENWHVYFDDVFSQYRTQFDETWVSWNDHFTEYQEQFDTAWFNWQEFFNTTWIEEAWKQNFVGEAGSFTRFFNEFVKKFVTHEYYDASGYNYNDVIAIQQKEDAQKGDAVHALADALTNNVLDLRDPQVQTNALLSQILVVATAIMNQNNNVAGTVSLSDALSSLALGLTTTTAMTETSVQEAATST